jgi:hypothetical protein
VRYEALLADPESEIAAVFDWLGLSGGADAIGPALWESRTARNEDVHDPRLAAGKWRDAFGEQELAEFEAVAGDLLAELGYERAVPVEAAAPAVATPVGTPRRARAALARLRPRPRADGQPAPKEVGAALMEAQPAVDAILEAIQVGAPERLREHLAADVRTRIIASEREQSLQGPDALIDWVRSDPVFAATQVRGDPHPGTPCYSVVLSYRLADESIESRVLEFIVQGSIVEQLTLYRFPAVSS